MTLWTNADFEALRRRLDSAMRARRRDVRYACFRMQSEAKGGDPAEPAHREIASTIETLPGFGGWENFGETWDVSLPMPIELVQRKWSIHDEWKQTMRRVAEPLPDVSDGG